MFNIFKLLSLYWYITFPLGMLLSFMLYYYYRKWKADIFNVAMYFRKGGSINEYKMKIRAGCVEFNPDESRVTVPVIAQPKMRVRKGRMERVFLIKEGTGATIEVMSEKELSDKQLKRVEKLTAPAG